MCFSEANLSRFDRLLISTCDVYRRGVGSPDDYDAVSQDLTIVESGIPCRKSILGPDDEFRQDKQFSSGVEKIFMRPLLLGSQGEKLSHHHMIVFEDLLYNVLSIKNPSAMNHHLEVYVEVIVP